MKRTIFFSGIIFLLMIDSFNPVRGQSAEEDFKNKINDNILYSKLISQYQQSQMWDSIRIVLKLWNKACGDIEPVIRAEILLAIQTGQFREDKLPVNIIDYLYAFSARNTSSCYYEKFSCEHKKDEDRWILDAYVDLDFNKSTKDWAEQMSKDTSLSDLEQAFCGFYAHRYDALAVPLSSGVFKGTGLEIMWKEHQSGWKKKGGAEMSIMYGFGYSRLVMPRLSAGFFFGASHKRISLNSSVQLSLALPLHAVTARNGLGELTAGKKFFGMNLNAGIGFCLAEYRKEQIWLNSDFGYERLNNDFSIDWSNIFDDGEDDYLDDDDDDEISPKKIKLQQFYPSLGIEWKRYPSYIKDRFTSYLLRFSIGDMNTGGGTKFKRGMISFHVRWGFIDCKQ